MPKVHHTVMSKEQCALCHKPLKENIVQAQRTSNMPVVCFACYRQGKDISTASEVRSGKKIGREKGIYR